MEPVAHLPQRAEWKQVGLSLAKGPVPGDTKHGRGYHGISGVRDEGRVNIIT